MKTKFLLITAIIFSLLASAQVNLNEGLVAYYPLNGDATDISGNNFHGTPLNGVDFSAIDRFGENNGAAQLDGDDDYIKLYTAYQYGLNPENGVSFSLWIKATEQRRIITNEALYENGGAMQISPDKYVYWKSRDNQDILSFNQNTLDGDWHHIVVFHINNTVKAFIDGQLDNEDNNFYPYTQNDNQRRFTIGDYVSQYLPYKGFVDDVRIYYRALTNDEVLALYNDAYSNFTCGQEIVDFRDGQTYQSIPIGNQCWMQENLKWLPSVNHPSQGSETEPRYYVYGYDGNNVDDAKNSDFYQTYGVLYNYPSLSNTCPYGWQVPGEYDFQILIDYLGNGSGNKLKEEGTFHWISNGGNNVSGFTALPGGSRSPNGEFHFNGERAHFAAYPENNQLGMWYLLLKHNSEESFIEDGYKNTGRSVRCIQNKAISFKANFSADKLTANVNEPIIFSDYSTGNPMPNSWTWYFDDGTLVENMQDVTHSFAEPGVYEVSLVVENENGEIDFVDKTITIGKTNKGINLQIIETGEQGVVDNIGYNVLIILPQTVHFPVDNNFARIEIADGYDGYGTRDDVIMLCDENNKTIGHIDFEYEYGLESQYQRDLILFFHNDDEMCLNPLDEDEPYFPYSKDSPDYHKRWNYYEKGEYPVSMLVPPNNTYVEDYTKEPLLLIHGWEGSFYYQKNPDAVPEDNEASYWFTTVKKLNENYPEFDTWHFYYPYNTDHEHLGLCLKEAIDYLTDESRYGDKRIKIATHSMGGLVTMRYLTEFKQDAEDKIEKVLFLAPPAHGSLGANIFYQTTGGRLLENVFIDYDSHAPAVRDMGIGSPSIAKIHSNDWPDLNGNDYIGDDYFVILGNTYKFYKSDKLLGGCYHEEAKNHHDGIVSISSGSILEKNIGQAIIPGNHNDLVHAQSKRRNNSNKQNIGDSTLIPELIYDYFSKDYDDFEQSLCLNSNVHVVIDRDKQVIKPETANTIGEIDLGNDVNFKKSMLNLRFIKKGKKRYSAFYNKSKKRILLLPFNFEALKYIILPLWITDHYYNGDIGTFIRNEHSNGKLSYYFNEESSEKSESAGEFIYNGCCIELEPGSNEIIIKDRRFSTIHESTIHFTPEYCEAKTILIPNSKSNSKNTNGITDHKSKYIIASKSQDSAFVEFYVDNQTISQEFCLTSYESTLDGFPVFFNMMLPDGTITDSTYASGFFEHNFETGELKMTIQNPMAGKWLFWLESNAPNVGSIPYQAYSQMQSDIIAFLPDTVKQSLVGMNRQISTALYFEDINLIDSLEVLVSVFTSEGEIEEFKLENTYSKDTLTFFSVNYMVDTAGLFMIKYNIDGVYDGYRFERCLYSDFEAIDHTPSIYLDDVNLSQTEPEKIIDLASKTSNTDDFYDSLYFSLDLISTNVDTSTYVCYLDSTLRELEVSSTLSDTGMFKYLVSCHYNDTILTDTLNAFVKLPDVILDDLILQDSTLRNGDTTIINYSLNNSGNIYTGSYQVKHFVSEDSIVDKSDYCIGARTVTHHPIDEILICIDTIVIPGLIINNDKRLISVVDYDSLIIETNKENNFTINEITLNAKPSAPTMLSAIPDDGIVELTWSSANDSDIKGYVIYYGQDTINGVLNDIYPMSIDTTYTISELQNDTEYYFAVSSYRVTLFQSDLSDFHAAIPSLCYSYTPTDLFADNITMNTAWLHWSPIGDEESWDIKWGVSGFDPYLEGTLIEQISEIQYELTNLTFENTYDFYVRSNCYQELYSAWGGPGTFQMHCGIPYNLEAIDTSPVSVTIEWNAYGEEEFWNLIYGEEGFDISTEGTVIQGIDTNPYNISELSPRTFYDLYIQAACSDSVSSDWSSKISFSSGTPIPQYLDSKSITPESVYLSWNTTGVPNVFEIRWGDSGFDPVIEGNQVNNVVANHYSLNELIPYHSYEYYVREVNPTFGDSEWVGPYGFAPTTNNCGTLMDADSNSYNTVIIGDQCWMQSNLRSAKYSNGDSVPTGLTTNEWANTTEGAMCIYDHSNVQGINSQEEMSEAYGNLYNWYAVDDSSGLCPEGWHVPGVANWDSFFNNISGGEWYGGEQLKSCRRINSPMGGYCDVEDHPRWDELSCCENYYVNPYIDEDIMYVDIFNWYLFCEIEQIEITVTNGTLNFFHYEAYPNNCWIDEDFPIGEVDYYFADLVAMCGNETLEQYLIFGINAINGFDSVDANIQLYTTGEDTCSLFLSEFLKKKNILNSKEQNHNVSFLNSKKKHDNFNVAKTRIEYYYTDEYYFSGLPAGHIQANGWKNRIGKQSEWWLSEEVSTNKAKKFGIYSEYSDLGTSDRSKSYGYSIRCVKDEAITTCNPPGIGIVDSLTTSSCKLSWLAEDTTSVFEIVYGIDGFNYELEGKLISGISDSTYKLDNLTPGTTYNAYIRKSCSETIHSEWVGPMNFTTIGEYMVLLSAEPAEGGTTFGEGVYIEGASVTISAIENTGWEFVNWTEDGVVLTEESEYTFTIFENRNIVANFYKDWLKSDSLALVAFYNVLDGPNWDNNDNWLIGPVSTWYGITIENSRVVSMEFWNEFNFNGIIPPEVGELTGLETFATYYMWFLKDNGYEGQRSGIFGEIPPEFGYCTNLKYFQIQQQQLSGNIPESFSSLTQLEYLDLEYNQLSGPIPDFLSGLENLESLILNGNDFSETIPSSIGGLSNLSQLNIGNNDLTGKIPSSIGNMANLELLDLGNNNLSGELPTTISLLANLQTLNLSNNEFTGPISSLISGLSDLYYLDLSKNFFSGNILPICENLNLLYNLNLSDNQFSGTIPSAIGQLNQLGVLDLRDNQFSGSIPSSIAGLDDIVILRVGSNQLSGTIPEELYTLTSLKGLDLCQNQFSGVISSSIGNLINIGTFMLPSTYSWVGLALNDNQFEGPVPVEICNNMPELWDLSLQNNFFNDESCEVIQCLIDKGMWEFTHSPQNDGFTYMGDCENYFTVETSANPENGGLTEGDGTYYIGDEVTISAEENPGWVFHNWTENGQEISTDNEYSFIIESDRTFSANFSVDCIAPTALAGDDQTICHFDSVFLTGYTENSASTYWSSNGDGIFISPESINSVYVPGEMDIISGNVKINLNALSLPPCDDTVTDQTNITIYCCQTIPINNGWSGISSYAIPVHNEFDILLSGILNNLIILQNQSGFYWPSQNINTIGTWNTHDGYQIKVSDNVEITISGTRENDLTLQLPVGWNLIPVLSECAVNVVSLFEETEPILAKEVAGWNVYWPEFGINTLEILEPGKAYFVLMETETELIFPECDNFKATTHKTLTGSETLSELQIHHTASSHTIAVPHDAMKSLNFHNGNLIIAYDHSGNCFGAGIWNGMNTTLTLFGNDPLTDAKDGFLENEALVFRLLDTETNQEYPLEVEFDQSMPNPQKVFNNHGLSAITSMKVSSSGISDGSANPSVEIIPNPAKDECLLSIGANNFEEGLMTIYKLDGQKMDEVEIINPQTKIDLRAFTPGIYLLQVKINNSLFTKRLIKN